MRPKDEPKRIEMTTEELDGFLARLDADELTEDDRGRIREVMAAVIWMAQTLENKELSIKRLQRLFGIKTEKASALFPENKDDNEKAPPGEAPGAADRNRTEEEKPGGKNGKADYPQAECILHPHATLKVGDACPLCGTGKIYFYGLGSVVRLSGQAPIKATIHQPEQLRCSSCQGFFTADLPESVGTTTSDETAKAVVSIFRYGGGIPFYRQEHLQDLFQTPLADSTQWDMSEALANKVYPVYKALLALAAQGTLLHSDDTGMKVLLLSQKLKLLDAERKGIFTTGVLARVEEREVALFFTGNRHAGENMEAILSMREGNLDPPMIVCDAASRNAPKGVEYRMGGCLDHARRQFVDIIPKYRDEAEHFIRSLKDVYRHDKEAKLLKLTPEERLRYHREKSLPIMTTLERWCMASFAAKSVEPNSPLGAAMKYFLNHYDKLTMFATAPGVPLSNSAVERLLKTAVLHRKNSLFYRTEIGAVVGDILMSLIQTAKRAHVNVLDYLTQLQLHAVDVKQRPEAWLPWNYLDRLAILQPHG